jgi:putative solute:sodium symporter small subunit
MTIRRRITDKPGDAPGIPKGERPLPGRQEQTQKGAGQASLRQARRMAHWRSTRKLTALLLLLWLSTGFCAVFFARELSTLSVFGWPLSFYMAAQGASLVYLALIGVYAWRMRRLDRRYGEPPQVALQGNRPHSRPVREDGKGDAL